MSTIVRPGGTVVLPQGENSEAIYEALLQMDWNDASNWDFGKPKMSVVSSLLPKGTKVSETQVEEVWLALVSKVNEIAGKVSGSLNSKRRA